MLIQTVKISSSSSLLSSPLQLLLRLHLLLLQPDRYAKDLSGPDNDDVGIHIDTSKNPPRTRRERDGEKQRTSEREKGRVISSRDLELEEKEEEERNAA